LPVPGRPRDTGKVDDLYALIEGEEDLSQKKIAQMLGMHHEAVRCIWSDDLSIRKGNFKRILHRLDSSQTAARVQVSRELRGSSKATETEVCLMWTLEMKRGCTWIILGRLC
jgi:predicted transcriptional regulator